MIRLLTKGFCNNQQETTKYIYVVKRMLGAADLVEKEPLLLLPPPPLADLAAVRPRRRTCSRWPFLTRFAFQPRRRHVLAALIFFSNVYVHYTEHIAQI